MSRDPLRPPSDFDDDSSVLPDGVTIRRRRRHRGWSRRDFVAEIARASETATGIAETIPPSLLQGIEEENEAVSYAVLRLIAGGLDCNPVELVLAEAVPPPGELH